VISNLSSNILKINGKSSIKIVLNFNF